MQSPLTPTHSKVGNFIDRQYIKSSYFYWKQSFQSLATNKEDNSQSADEDRSEMLPGDLESDPQYEDIIAPEYHELVAGGDIIFFSSAQDVVQKMLKSIMGESNGLKILKSDVFALPGYGTEVVECVVSHTNPF